jgi:hypothetical protein
MLICTTPAKKRKAIQRRDIFITAVIANTTALLLRGDFVLDDTVNGGW